MATFTDSDVTASAYLQMSLSEYAQKLVVSNKRRYLEKIAGIGDPFCIPKTELSEEAFPPVEATDIITTLFWAIAFAHLKGSKHTKALMHINILYVGL